MEFVFNALTSRPRDFQSDRSDESARALSRLRRRGSPSDVDFGSIGASTVGGTGSSMRMGRSPSNQLPSTRSLAPPRPSRPSETSDQAQLKKCADSPSMAG